MSGISSSPLAKAYTGPFLVFIALLLVGEAVAHFGEGSAAWWIDEPKYWVFPLQTIVCGALLVWWWRKYEFNWGHGWWLGIIAGAIALAVWVAPQQWPADRDPIKLTLFGTTLLDTENRVGGFDLWFFGGGTPYKWNLTFRLIRLVIVVPLLEELFWRGFLLRHLMHDPFDKIPFGTRSWSAFLWVAGLFAVAHLGPDFFPALITGALYNAVAFTTRSIGACVIAHAVTNLLLGLYIFKTQQWGFW
jgi:uncharacterized protein